LFLLISASAQQTHAQTGLAGSDTIVNLGSAAPTVGVGAVPRFIRFSGAMRDPNGDPLRGVVDIELGIYRDREGGDAVWLETQNVELDDQGRYAVLIGATKKEGISPDMLGSGELRWLSVRQVGAAEQPRMLMVSVPYALRAEEAMKLGGSSADEFVRKQDLQQALEGTANRASGESLQTIPQVPPKRNDKAATPAATSGPTTFSGSTTTNIVLVQQMSTGRALVATATSGTAFVATATSGGAISATGGPSGVYGNATSSAGIGIQGVASAIGTATGIGVSGISASGFGIGVTGSGGAIGVSGGSRSSPSSGVKGESTDTTDLTGNDFGVSGIGHNPTGAGVSGANVAVTGNAFGVIGTSSSSSGIGVFGKVNASAGNAVNGTNAATTGNAIGVTGISSSPAGTGVFGSVSAPTGNAVVGINNATSGYGAGVSGKSSSPEGNAVTVKDRISFCGFRLCGNGGMARPQKVM
jgi:hypothetical protein